MSTALEMSSATDFDSDAAYARQLQDEEFSAIRVYENQQPHRMNGTGTNQPSGGRYSSDHGGDSRNNSQANSAESSLNLHPSSGGGDRDSYPASERYHAVIPNSHPSSANRPLLERAVVGAGAGGNQQNRAVHLNAVEQANQIQENSLPLLVIYITYGLCELVMAIVALSKGWDQYCDRPLRTWIIFYSGRWLALIPLAIVRFTRRHIVYNENNPDPLLKWQSWVRFAAFVWMIIGQYYYFTSTCTDDSPWLSKFTLAMIIIFYIGVCLPLIILLVVCLCLPCALILLQIFQTEPGAPREVINSLPKRTYQPPPPGEGGAEAAEVPSCSICMEDFKAGDELRHLPCNHEFHVPCVDRWLALNQTCPLCRKDINSDPANPVVDVADNAAPMGDAQV